MSCVNLFVILKTVLVEDLNIISIEWSALAGPGPHYFLASANCFPTGEYVAEFLDWLMTYTGADVTSFHPIGFSLGAQVVGSIGYNLQTKYGKMLDRISGLDPAGPYFMKHSNNTGKLSREDARFVDVIYSSGRWIGTHEEVGQV